VYGEFLLNAQGEDVVAGIRTPLVLSELHNYMPEAYDQLIEIRGRLEKHYRDMQDFEFTIQEKKLWMLQTRNGKRTGFAAVADSRVDMVEEGLISPEEAILRIRAGEPERPVATDIRRQCPGSGPQGKADDWPAAYRPAPGSYGSRRLLC